MCHRELVSACLGYADRFASALTKGAFTIHRVTGRSELQPTAEEC